MANKITKDEILTREFNKYFEKKIMLGLQLAHQKKLDPNEMSAKKALRRGSDGQPISWQDISRKEHIEILEKDLEDVEVILKTIKELE